MLCLTELSMKKNLELVGFKVEMTHPKDADGIAAV